MQARAEGLANITFAAALREALAKALREDPNVMCFGLGVDDPKGVFSTTLDLHKEFGSHRVFDTPTSENAMTGIGIGAAINGMRVVMLHQRADFALLAMDQIVNNAAKYHFMFGGKLKVPITLRLIIGRGWGQGPTHSQNLQALFAHIPGLKIVMPATVADAWALLLASIFDDNPVIFLEHRWLHNQTGDINNPNSRPLLGKAKVLRTGKDITLIGMSYMVIEALNAQKVLLEREGISCEVIDLRTIKPLDWETITQSVEKTQRCIILDTGHQSHGVSAEIFTGLVEKLANKMKSLPIRMAMPDIPEPTSHFLTKKYYYTARDICQKVGALLGRKNLELHIPPPKHHDVPGDWFSGPF